MAAADQDRSRTNPVSEIMVGKRLRHLRNRRGFSLRALADRSGLNFNTLSLIENGKTSPSVGTLYQLALALETPITDFFEMEPKERRVVFTSAGQRPQVNIGATVMENLGKDLAGNSIQPFLITLEPGMGSGERAIVHTGHEFIYCLAGRIRYKVENEEYHLNSGDSLVFESHLPHCWENNGDCAARILLVLFPSDKKEEPGGRHFTLATMIKEINMKIAAITDDGKTISQHFGRAQYYTVVSVENGQIVAHELRNKLGHSHFANQPHQVEIPGQPHGMDPTSHNKHLQMAEAIADCEAVLCRGMGMGAYESMKTRGIRPVVTDIADIDEAVMAYIEGTIVDQVEKLH